MMIWSAISFVLLCNFVSYVYYCQHLEVAAKVEVTGLSRGTDPVALSMKINEFCFQSIFLK